MEEDSYLQNKTKAEVAAAVRAACASEATNEIAEKIVDEVFTNYKALSDVDDEETLEWCRWLVAGGTTPEEFSNTVRLYDKATTCGLVWTENFVAYRCRTCGISPFISLCTDCFHKGNHEGHDFIVFRSETGGACDCGEINVIKESGCCVLHGPRGTAAMRNAQNNSMGQSQNTPGSNDLSSSEQSAPPAELFCVANKLMPRLFHRLIAYLRAVEARKLAREQELVKNKTKKSRPKTSPMQNVSLAATAAAMWNSSANIAPKGHKFIKLLQGFSDMGITMRQIMTQTLTQSPEYKDLCGRVNPDYERIGLRIPEYSRTFLDELVYWTVKREFPEDLVCLLLSLRSDYNYNEHLARAFITHYELISQSILKSSDPERLCKHIAAVSVQLFSKEKLAIAMVEQMQLLHLLLRSLHEMIKSTAIPISSLPAISSSSSSSSSIATTTTTTSPLSSGMKSSETKRKTTMCDADVDEDSDDVHSTSSSKSGETPLDSEVTMVDESAKSILKVIDCDNDIIKNNYYWLIKSDLKALLSHGPVATKFFNDPQLLSTWFEFLTLLQGMNVNKYVRKGEPHVEHEPDSYVGAFMAELVISAMLMWTLVSHLTTSTTSATTLNFIDLCRQQLKQWHEHVKYPKDTISFHLPLHRYLSTFIRQGLQYQGITLEQLLPPEEEFDVIIQHILRLQVAYYEISSRLWARNGPSLVNQAEYYVSSLCCNSMVDADLFLLQIAAVKMPGISEDKFLRTIITEFGLTDILSIRKYFDDASKESLPSSPNNCNSEEQITMLENFMIFLAIIATARTNLGIPDKDLMALEMSVLLCKSDRLHSELMEMLPERCGSDSQVKVFEAVLETMADFQAPRNMQQGIFTPKPCVWEEIYDPVYTLLRSSSKAEYQSCRDRFQDYAKRCRKEINANNLWPPFRIPKVSPSFMRDPGKILLSKDFTEIAFIIINDKLNMGMVSELTLSLCVYLLEVAVCVAESEDELLGFLMEIYLPQSLETGGTEKRRVECILSLLLELYSKFSDGKVFCSLQCENISEEPVIESRIGDGSFFVGKILEKLMLKSSKCKDYILQKTQAHHSSSNPSSPQELSSEELEREKKRTKAKERKLLILDEYAKKRQQFMNTTNVAFDEEDGGSNKTVSTSPEPNSTQKIFSEFKDQECVICMEKLENRPNNLFGLMTYLSPCEVLGYQRLHTPEGDGPFLKVIHKETLTEYLKFFESTSMIQHVPLDPGFGIPVQTCGHLIHQDCFTSYMNYVKKAPPPPGPSFFSTVAKPVHAFTYKEFTCPLCRQVGNSFLPIIFPKSISKTNQENKLSGSCEEISKLLKKRNKCSLSNVEKIAIESFIKDINGCAMNNFSDDLVKLLKECDVASPHISAFWLTSHFRILVERQLKLSEVSNVSASSSASNSAPTKKLSNFLPLLSVMKCQYKSLPVSYSRKLAQSWGMICGKKNQKGNKEVPTLLRDVETELYHFILDLPILEDLSRGIHLYQGVVQALYNLKVVQILASICSQFSEAERQELSQAYAESQSKMERSMYLIFTNFGEVKVEFPPAESVDTSDILKADENGNHKSVDIPETSYIENLIQNLLVPFLKTAAHVKSELFSESVELPGSFRFLVEYLQLGQQFPAGTMQQNSAIVEMENTPKSCWDFVLWTKCDDEVFIDSEVAIENWCSELMQSVNESEKGTSSSTAKRSEAVGELLKAHLYMYDKPSLIKLPHEYDSIFENYRKIKCLKCEKVPSTPALCLICGEILCLNDLCCFNLEMEVSEVVSHCQKKCGRGTGIFLSVMTSEILIVREKEACIWGSIFLDSFCEEDLELKRGKPLFLCQERLDILQKSWITQSFYKAELKWFPHENFL